MWIDRVATTRSERPRAAGVFFTGRRRTPPSRTQEWI